MTTTSIPGRAGPPRFTSVGAARWIRDLHGPSRGWAGFGTRRCRFCATAWGTDGCPDRTAANAFLSEGDAIGLWRRLTIHPIDIDTRPTDGS